MLFLRIACHPVPIAIGIVEGYSQQKTQQYFIIIL